jgi:hypothetical protein
MERAMGIEPTSEDWVECAGFPFLVTALPRLPAAFSIIFQLHFALELISAASSAC